MALFPLINPITCATAYLGGIEIIMCTWSGSRCPSSIRLSFCSASLRNTSPKYFRNSPYNAFRRPFGINTTWYLHSHFEWLKLSYSSIQFLLCMCFAAHAWSFLDGLPYLSNFACLPGRAGGTPISLAYRHPAQRHFGQINPAFSIAFHESERTDPERTRVRVGPPTLTSDGFYLLGLVHRIRFYDGEMRHIRPRLLIVQRAPVEEIVQFAHPIGAARHAQEDGGSDRDKALHVPHSDFEGCDRLADLRQHA